MTPDQVELLRNAALAAVAFIGIMVWWAVKEL